jgi:N-acetylneuraminate synthase/N,N'-diacetyllegionaminate synthase
MPAETLRIGDRVVGDGAPVYVIAEAGVNHNGELGLALELVDAAADAGADAVKFQTFEPSAIVVAGGRQAAYQRERAAAQDQRAMLDAVALDAAAFERIAGHARDRGVTFLSTPFDERSADVLERLDVEAFKVGSGELTNLPFLRSLGARGRPMLISTGMGTLEEIDAAVTTAGDAGAGEIALLHCVSSYPTPPEQANLRALDTLHERFPGVVIGYSDHCLGLDVSLAAVGRGAHILERHFTLDPSLPGPDHALSLTPEELGDLVARVRVVRSALGDGIKAPQPSERDVMAVARRSLVAARDLRSGQRIEAADIAAKRPAGGLTPDRIGELIGRRLARDVPADAQLSENDLAPER